MWGVLTSGKGHYNNVSQTENWRRFSLGWPGGRSAKMGLTSWMTPLVHLSICLCVRVFVCQRRIFWRTRRERWDDGVSGWCIACTPEKTSPNNITESSDWLVGFNPTFTTLPTLPIYYHITSSVFKRNGHCGLPGTAWHYCGVDLLRWGGLRGIPWPDSINGKTFGVDISDSRPFVTFTAVLQLLAMTFRRRTFTLFLRLFKGANFYGPYPFIG